MPKEDLEAARQKAAAVVVKLREMKLKAASECVEAGVEETLRYMDHPRELAQPAHEQSAGTSDP